MQYDRKFGFVSRCLVMVQMRRQVDCIICCIGMSEAEGVATRDGGLFSREMIVVHDIEPLYPVLYYVGTANLSVSIKTSGGDDSTESESAED